MFKHLLLPTDGSALSDAAIESGIELAKFIGAQVTGICVLPKEYPSYYNGEIPGGFKEEAAGEFRANARLHLAALAKLAEGVGVACDEVVEASDQPYEAIVRTAEEKHCDLILMASHGKRGIQALLLGSVTQKVLTHSRIPVLVYR
jgi:nucleotide-binding universal stress UspA family protein